jgi:MFS family permease
MTTVAAIAAHFIVPRSPTRAAGRIGFTAPLLLSAWLVALLVAVSEAPDWGWGSGKVLGLLALAVIVAGVWVAVEHRSEHPLIDMEMMRRPAVWTTNLVALLFGVSMYATFAFLPEFLQTEKSTGYGFGLSTTQSGLLMFPMAVGMFALGIASGRLTRRVGSKVLLVAGAVVSVAPLLIMAFAHGHAWEILVAMALQGIGFGLAFAAMSNLIVAAVPPEQTGVASGMNANIRTIGGSIGAALMASIVTSHVADDGLPTESGYTNGFLMLSIAAVLALAFTLLIPSIRRDPVSHAEPEIPLPHAEMSLVAGGTLSGDDPE